VDKIDVSHLIRAVSTNLVNSFSTCRLACPRPCCC
jgi:hypothetical protein